LFVPGGDQTAGDGFTDGWDFDFGAHEWMWNERLAMKKRGFFAKDSAEAGEICTPRREIKVLPRRV
jgi:hypothetical protein